MDTALSRFSDQEKDVQLFLESLGVSLLDHDKDVPDEYLFFHLNPEIASFFEARENKAVLLAYRVLGRVFPLLLAFLKGNEEIDFCYSNLLLDSYFQGTETALLLRAATDDFFSQELPVLLTRLEPSWGCIPLNGYLDCPIFWDTKPELNVVIELLKKELGEIGRIPLFPSVFYYNNIYDQNLLEAALPELGGYKDILVMGCGAGLEAICIALKYGVHVDATDINPIAVANTVAACRRTGTENMVSAWVSDGFSGVKKMYDAILFEAPLATNERHLQDPNRYDLGGKLLRAVLKALPLHLKLNGRMYLMSRPNLTPYLPPGGLESKVLRYFAEHESLAIHEIRLEEYRDESKLACLES